MKTETNIKGINTMTHERFVSITREAITRSIFELQRLAESLENNGTMPDIHKLRKMSAITSTILDMHEELETLTGLHTNPITGKLDS